MREGSLLQGGYRLLKQIDKSSNSIVYLAVDERSNKQLAIKEIKREYLDYEIGRASCRERV